MEGKPSTQAIAALLCALVGLMIIPMGLPAVVLALRELGDIRRHDAPVAGRSISYAALVLGGLQSLVIVAIFVVGFVSEFQNRP